MQNPFNKSVSASFNGYFPNDCHKWDKETENATFVYTKAVFDDGSQFLQCSVEKDNNDLSALNLMANEQEKTYRVYLEAKRSKRLKENIYFRSQEIFKEL